MRPAELLILPKGDRGKLMELLRTEKDAKMWQRYQSILLCSKKPKKEVAKMVNMTYRNLNTLTTAYKKKGIEGLKYRKPPGKTPKITEEKKEKIIKILDSNPYGWETKNIKDTIIKQAGVTYTNRHVTRIAHKWGYTKVVPRPRNRRMSPSALYQFKKKRRRG
jgi:transposase